MVTSHLMQQSGTHATKHLPHIPTHGHPGYYTSIVIPHNNSLPVVNIIKKRMKYFTLPVSNIRYEDFREAHAALWEHNRQLDKRTVPSVSQETIQEHETIVEVYEVQESNRETMYFLEPEPLEEYLDARYRTVERKLEGVAQSFGFQTLRQAFQHTFVRDIVLSDPQRITFRDFSAAVDDFAELLCITFYPDKKITTLPSASTDSHNIEKTMLVYAIRQRFSKLIHKNVTSLFGEDAFTAFPLDWLLEAMDKAWINQRLIEYMELTNSIAEQNISLTGFEEDSLILFHETLVYDTELFELSTIAQ